MSDFESIARRLALECGGDASWCDFVDDARDLIDLFTDAGWCKIGPDEVVVPRMATTDMVSSGYNKITSRIEIDDRDLFAVYSAMIAADHKPGKRNG